MPIFRRVIAAAIGLALPVALAGAVEAAPRHSHRPAHVRTATYKVAQHKALRHRQAKLATHRMAQAQAQHRHANMRGS